MNPKDWVKTTWTTTTTAVGETTSTTAAAGETTSTTELLCQTLIIEEKPGNLFNKPGTNVSIKKLSKYASIPKHGSSDGRAGDSRLKGSRFKPHLDPMRPATKLKSY